MSLRTGLKYAYEVPLLALPNASDGCCDISFSIGCLRSDVDPPIQANDCGLSFETLCAVSAALLLLLVNPLIMPPIIDWKLLGLFTIKHSQLRFDQHYPVVPIDQGYKRHSDSESDRTATQGIYQLPRLQMH